VENFEMNRKSTKAINKKHTEYDSSHQTKILEIIAGAQELYLSCHSIEDIYHIATEKIYNILGEGYIVTSILDEPVQAMRIIDYRGFTGVIERIQEILHVDPRNMMYYLKDMSEEDIILFRSGKLEIYKEGIYGLLTRQVPRSLCKMLERYLGVKETYTIAFTYKSLHFGGLSIITKRDISDIKWAIELLVNQAAIIINQKRSENALKKSEELYRSLFENMINSFIYCKMVYENGNPIDYIFLIVNKAFEKQTGFTNVIGKKVTEVIPNIRNSAPQLFEVFGRVALTGTPEGFETYIAPIKSWFYISVYSPQKEYFVAIFDDITEQKKTGDRIIHINSVLKVLREINQLITREKDRLNLITKACDLLVEIRGFEFAWILLLDDNRKCDIATASGHNNKTANKFAELLTNDIYQDCVKALMDHSDIMAVCTDITGSNSICLPRQSTISGKGLTGRMEYEGKLYGILSVYLPEEMVYDSEEQSLFRELLNDLAFALFRIEAEEKRKQISEQLQAAEKRYRTTLDNMIEGCQIIDFSWRYSYLNKAGVKHSRRTEKELLGHTMMEIYPGIEKTELFNFMSRCMHKRTAHTMQNEFTFTDGSKGWFELRIEPVPEGIFILSKEITEQKNAEKALKISEEQYRLLVETANEGIVVTQNGIFKFANRRMAEILDYSPEELYNMSFLDTVHPDYREDIKDRHQRRLRGELIPGTFTIRVLDKSGNIKWVELNVVMVNWQDRPATLTFVNEITERKLAQDALQKSNERFQRISKITSDIAYSCIKNQNGDYSIDWISGATEIIVGYSVDEIKLQSCWRFLVIDDDLPLFEKNVLGLSPGHSGSCDLRLLRKDGEIVWVTSYAECVDDPDDPQLYHLYGGLIDITERKKLEILNQNSLQKLRGTVEGAINSISLIAETRDPYTAGHQRNVTKIATAIARELDLGEDKIETIRVAAMLHDIGKIQIPAEILSKPTRLSDVEMELVRSHPGVGSEILNTIDLPWSVSPIVLQHHERMNGSGYPNKLSSDNILFEARILAVADVVEAMASHRPYRPSMGIENALQEISSNSGILYDTVVVDACLRLFREKNFTF